MTRSTDEASTSGDDVDVGVDVGDEASGMTAAEIMIERPVLCPPGATVEEAARLMAEHDVAAVVVLEAEDTLRPMGLVHEHDVVARCVAKGLDARTLRVVEITPPSLLTIAADADLSLAADLLSGDAAHTLVVVDADGNTVGLLSVLDLAMAGVPVLEVEFEEEPAEGDEGADEADVAVATTD